MTKHDITTLACRIVAFLIFVDTAFKILYSVQLILASLDIHQPPQIRMSGILELIAQLVVIIFCFLLWVKAEKIANRFVPASTTENVVLIDEDPMSSVIALAGIVILILTISLALTSVFNIFVSNQLKMHNFGLLAHSRLITAVFQMAIGIGLFFGANGISQKLRYRIYYKAQV